MDNNSRVLERERKINCNNYCMLHIEREEKRWANNFELLPITYLYFYLKVKSMQIFGL